MLVTAWFARPVFDIWSNNLACLDNVSCCPSVDLKNYYFPSFYLLDRLEFRRESCVNSVNFVRVFSRVKDKV